MDFLATSLFVTLFFQPFLLKMFELMFFIHLFFAGGMYGVPPLMDRYGLGLPIATAAMVIHIGVSF